MRGAEVPADGETAAEVAPAAGGGKVAFRVSGPSARVEVVDVKSAEVLLRRDGAAKALRWADERALLVDGTRVPLP
mgnify:CR=1 FL=1